MNDLFNENEFRGVDLNVLLIFLALMRERSVTRAAARMFLGPSAVSMALRRLRELFDDPLLVRAKGGMEPTPRALELYPVVEAAIGRLHQVLFTPAQFDPSKLEKTFRFAAPDDLELALVPLILAHLRRASPKVRLVVRPSDYRHALDSLDRDDCDLALTAMPDQLESWHCHRVLHQESFLTLYDRTQLGLRGDLSLDDYVAHPHLLLSPLGHLHSPIDEQLRELGRSRTVLVSVAHFPLMPFLLRTTPSVVNMPATAARIYAKEFDLELSKAPIQVPTFDVALLWHVRKNADPAVQWFAGLVAQLVAQLRQ
ncbi:hypothetical protein B0920_19850 [Massilia sp. KIM]|uniref:LysR substrate-binding domain-containing protein n=1 Tax=Massilia sp. KIM TaxID=1955422 RepID=UPI0009CD756E|nr:LysR substrate-binding domain-containing protein [Massilia sp. KIM]OON61172.1 hypothetical protein B0920_19850 [Massilia sp. KIM]